MCGCQRTTYLCSCRHKERIIERCHIYQLRQDGSCFAYCFPHCRTKVRKHRLQRVCRKCEEYFREKYGEEHHKRFTEAFLEYKEKKGWAKTAIDPRTVPREVLLQRQSAPAGLGARMKKQPRVRGQPYPVHQNMTVPSTPPAIRNRERLPTPAANHDNRNPGPAAGVTGRQQDPRIFHMNLNLARTKRKGTPFPYERTPSPNSSDVRFPQVSGDGVPLPTDPNLFAVGDEEEDYDGDGDNDDACKARVFTPSPVPIYDSTNLPPGIGLIPELAHLAQGRRTSRARRRRSFPVLEHPAPKTYKLRKALRRDSDCSLVKKLTKAARRIEIPNLDYIEFEGMLVPRIMTPPKGSPRTRTPITSDSSRAASPEPDSDDDTSAIDIAIAANEVPESLIPGRGAAEDVDGRRTKSTSTYFVVAETDAHSPTGASARVRHSPSHESVVIPPPPRLDGVLIPSAAACPHHANKAKGSGDDECPTCRSAFFKERGLPSNSYPQRECRSATLPVVVSVHVPERRYSCAVQSCYCKGDKSDKDSKCPSCREREAITRELHTTWI
ncbi:hypothetical protein F4678DRAFT_417560 [Xylaria arbuscula]|nr:hypothetical protein F4678DRAFT_417560 [Xylaria arbuscula]